MLIRLFDPRQPRDAKGRWAETGSVWVGDRDITVVLPKRAAVAGDTLVPVDVATFDAEFQRDTDLYLSQGGGKNAIGERYVRFGKFIAENTSIEAAEVTVQDNGKVGFTNGRHRWAWLRDQGVSVIPVAMTPESVINAKKYGFLATRKWDEAKHPRDAEGQWTATFDVREYPHGGAAIAVIDPTLPAYHEDDGTLRAGDAGRIDFNEKIYQRHLVVEHIFIRPAYRGKGVGTQLYKQALAYAKRKGLLGIASGGEDARRNVITDKIWKHHRTGTRGSYDVMTEWREPAEKWDPQQPRDAKGRFVDLGLHGDQVTLLHGTTRQNAEAILSGGFKPGHPERVAAQMEAEYKLPPGSIVEHVAFQFARGRKDLNKVHFTTDESVADQYSVPEVVQDALTSAHMLLHPTPDDEPYTKEKHAERKAWVAAEAKRLMEPALLAVTVPFDVVGQHGFGKQFTLTEFKDLLTKFPRAEEDIFNNITIPISALTQARIARRKWDESQHPRGTDGRFTYAPQHDAPVGGEWDRTGVDPHAMTGPGPQWRQQHRQLVADALRSWVGDPSSFRIHAQDALTGAEVPPSGSGKQMRAQAEALLWELEHKAVPIPVTLYRGSGQRGDKAGAPFSWSESEQIAKVFATRYGGKVEILPTGTSRGLRVRDYTRDAFGEKQWIVRAGNNPVQKQDHKFGNTQIAIPPTSAAAASLNAARAQILDDDTMATGKDVDPNHVTVRFGLENDDLDDLRLYIARQLPFEAYISGIELFPASEHSDGAVPVVARIASPELREIEAAIGRHADFKEKSFPVYKPHCTLAYCKPGSASKYLDLPVQGAFLVQDITISHASGVKETIAFGGARKFDEAKHPRQPAGSTRGGEFMATLHSPGDALQSLLNKDTDVSIDRNDVRAFLDLAAEQNEDPNMSHLHVEGTEMFGGHGLGILREDMPQIPRIHRERFLDEMAHEGVEIAAEKVDPLTLKPTQSEVSARNVALKLQEYEEGKKKFPPLLVSEDNRILDGHHHWGMMAAFALEFPDAKVPIFRLKIPVTKALALMHTYDKKYGIVRKALGSAKKADPATGRYVTPFVSFEKQGDAQLQLIASLNSSRLATWGFTAEAEVLGMARYRLSAVLDGRTSDFCRAIDGKIFNVPDARKKVIEVLNVQNPEDLRTVQPWPKQTKAAIQEFKEMSAEELTALGFHIPPYHPYCRTICRIVPSSEGELEEEDEVPTIPDEVEAFHPITAADLKELGIEASPEDVAQWNAHVGMTPVELLTRLSGLPPREVMTKPLGVGANPIVFTEQGIGFNVRGSSPSGVEFKLGAILEPFTGTYYLTQADLIAGSPKAETSYLKQVFSALIEMGLKSSATEVAVGVGGNAAYYAKLGFLPDELEWDTLRSFALNEVALQPVLASLTAEDRLLVQHLLQDKSVQAMNTLVKLPFTYQGKTIGEWLFGEATGTWALDLTDEVLVAQAQAYLL